MEKRVAIVKIDGQRVLGTIEKHCSPSCPCEKPREKGIANLATLKLTHFDPQCYLQRIPGIIEGSLLPQTHSRLGVLPDAEFEAYCKAERQLHLTKVDEHVRFLADPGNRFSYDSLANKLWNEHAVKVYSQALAANAINGNAIISLNATTREQKVKTLSDALENGFTIGQLKMLISSLVPNWESLRELPKEQQQGRGKNGEWKSAFPAAVAALEAGGYMINSLFDKRLSLLFKKELGVSISDKTFAKRRIQDEVFKNNNYLEKAASWLHEEFSR